MRGKVNVHGAQRLKLGITPAYAGKSHDLRTYELGPRGSPPHMRGKELKRPMGDASAEDHPRICGEKSLIHHGVTVNEGSPPHMRGKANPPTS